MLGLQLLLPFELLFTHAPLCLFHHQALLLALLLQLLLQRLCFLEEVLQPGDVLLAVVCMHNRLRCGPCGLRVLVVGAKLPEKPLRQLQLPEGGLQLRQRALLLLADADGVLLLRKREVVPQHRVVGCDLDCPLQSPLALQHQAATKLRARKQQQQPNILGHAVLLQAALKHFYGPRPLLLCHVDDAQVDVHDLVVGCGFTNVVEHVPSQRDVALLRQHDAHAVGGIHVARLLCEDFEEKVQRKRHVPVVFLVLVKRASVVDGAQGEQRVGIVLGRGCQDALKLLLCKPPLSLVEVQVAQ
mmetsp:Transcript_32279/g.80948  ORF Transcript_32279/g.80948 Transcript_32279/m.80948 type:complete len:300 (-) Transcript_32279:78-977(-)